MDVYKTDEEQVEAIKGWWKENGRSIITGISIALLLVFAWRVWQDHSRTQKDLSSAAFQEVLEASQKLSTATSEDLSAESIEIKSVNTLAAKVLEEYSDTIYANYTRLILAKSAVMLENWSEAETQLKNIIRSSPDSGMLLLAKYRLAKVLYETKAYDQALEMLDSIEPGAFEAAFAELKGDISVRLSDLSAARKHYELALELVKSDSVEQQGVRQAVLEMKFHDLAPVE